jgi:hypothetical protein
MSSDGENYFIEQLLRVRNRKILRRLGRVMDVEHYHKTEKARVVEAARRELDAIADRARRKSRGGGT